MLGVFFQACLDDNYAFLVIDTGSMEAAVVDACDPFAVNRAVSKVPGIKLTHVLTTHRHWVSLWLRVLLVAHLCRGRAH